MNSIIRGTVVRLRSGGPKMTCEIAVGDTHTVEPYKAMVRCQWFEGHKVESEWFPPESLEIVSVEPAVPVGRNV